MSIPLPQPVVDKLGTSVWDRIVDALADELKRRGRPNWAKRVKRLRMNPDLREIMRNSVRTGWAHWLKHYPDHRLVEAIKQHYDVLSTTMVSDIRTVFQPLKSDGVQAVFTQWFHSLECGLAPVECDDAARALIDDIFKAAQADTHLQPYVDAALKWADVERQVVPQEGPRVEAMRTLALAAARADRCLSCSTAHIVYGLSALTPVTVVQHSMHTLGLTPDRVRSALRGMGFKRQDGIEPEESGSVGVLMKQAEALAERRGASQINDHHVLLAAALVAADTHCAAGRTLRTLFSRLGVSPEALATSDGAYESWSTLVGEDPGALLSSRGM